MTVSRNYDHLSTIIEKKTAARHLLQRFAKLLFEMGQLDESEQFYRRLLNDPSSSISIVARDDMTRIHCHMELTRIVRIKNRYTELIENTKETVEILKKTQSRTRILPNLMNLILAEVYLDSEN